LPFGGGLIYEIGEAGIAEGAFALATRFSSFLGAMQRVGSAIVAGLGGGEVQFGQRGVSANFKNGDFAGQSIGDVVAGLRSGAIRPSQLPLQTITRDGIVYTMNNRSLMALRLAGKRPAILVDVTGNKILRGSSYGSPGRTGRSSSDRIHTGYSSPKAMNTERIQLPHPTNRTMDGPLFRQERNRLVVEYDFQFDNGTVQWTTLTFLDVLAVEYRQSACCAAESVVSAREMHSVGDSRWLSEILAIWTESVGWQDWHKRQGGASRFKHFSLFFDDAGCVSVIAAFCEIGG
jgi:hypothetical protein